MRGQDSGDSLIRIEYLPVLGLIERTSRGMQGTLGHKLLMLYLEKLIDFFQEVPIMNNQAIWAGVA